MDNQRVIASADSINSLTESRPPKGTKLRSKLDDVYRNKYDDWLRSFSLKPSWESHSDLVEPHIWHGYRPNPASFRYCLRSAFYPTNETLNMWTHLIPGLLMIWKTFEVISSLENPTDTITYPLWMYSFGCCFVFFCSAAAHLLNCYSVSAQELCFCLDYGGIAVFGLTMAVSFQYMTCPTQCFGFDLSSFPCSYIFMIFLLMLLSLHTTCRSRHPGCSMRYWYRFGPYAASYVITGFPCLIRYLSLEHPNIIALTGYFPDDSKQCHLGEDYASSYVAHLAFLIAAIGFVTTRFPESIFPGTFDIVGNSHQWFHVCVACGIYQQHAMTKDALMDALQLRKTKVLKEEEMDFRLWSNLIPLIMLIVLMLLISFRSSRRNSHALKSLREAAKN